MNKIITLLFTCFSFSSLKAQYYEIQHHGLGQQLYNLYPTCVTNPEFLIYYLDTTCAEIINEDSLHIHADADTRLEENDLRFFVNLKYLKLDGQDLDGVIFPKRLREVDFYGSSSIGQIDIGDSLEKIRMDLSHVDFGVVPASVREIALKGSIIYGLSVIPDSLESIRISPYDDLAYDLPPFGSFQNAHKFKSFYFEGDYDQTFHTDVLATMPPDVESIFIKSGHADEVTGLPAGLDRFHLMANTVTMGCDFPPNLRHLYLEGQISCLPLYPETLDSIIIISWDYFCHPNYVPNTGMSTELCSNPDYNFYDCPGEKAIGGYVYQDFSENCEFDLQTDFSLANVPVDVFDENGNFLQKFYSGSNGYYAFSLPEGTYKVVLDTNGTSLRKSCAGQEYEYVVTLDEVNSYSEVNFQLQCDTLTYNQIDSFDLKINAVMNSGANFPGLPGVICVSSRDLMYNPQLNCGSGVESYLDSVVNFQVRITGPVTFTDTSALFTSAYSGDTLIVNYNDSLAQYYGFRSFCFQVQTDTTAQLGDIVCVEAEIFPPAGDVDLSNNVLTHCFQVVNSYDPNMKETWPFQMKPGFDDEIRYTIHFQNTGNAPAINIQLVDTLDEQLDLATFRVVQSSHDVTPMLNGNNLRFKFANINLADSLSDPEGSKGYVEYAIRPKNPMQLDEKIYNTAYIYFDYNDPIITNTTENWCTTFELNVAEADEPENKLLIYPNPLGADRLLKIRKTGKEETLLRIFDLNGTQVLQANLSDYQNTIDLKQLNPGVYILKSESASGMYSGKLVLM